MERREGALPFKIKPVRRGEKEEKMKMAKTQKKGKYGSPSLPPYRLHSCLRKSRVLCSCSSFSSSQRR